MLPYTGHTRDQQRFIISEVATDCGRGYQWQIHYLRWQAVGLTMQHADIPTLQTAAQDLHQQPTPGKPQPLLISRRTDDRRPSWLSTQQISNLIENRLNSRRKRQNWKKQKKHQNLNANVWEYRARADETTPLTTWKSAKYAAKTWSKLIFGVSHV